jgi:hypothetical protein
MNHNDRFEFVGMASINRHYRGEICTARPIPENELRNLDHTKHVYVQFHRCRTWWPARKEDLRPLDPNKPII